MSPRSRFLAACLVWTAWLPLARALPTAAQIATALGAIDTTANGAIDAAEWRNASFVLFQAHDKNNNDFIDGDEIKGSNLAQDTFLRLDANHDGRLSIDEFMKMRRELFAVADRNRDDYITLVEFELLVVFEAVGWQDKNGDGRVDNQELRTALGKLVELLDADKNAGLSPNEAAFMPATRFTRFDKNEDGALSLEELVAGYRSEFEA